MAHDDHNVAHDEDIHPLAKPFLFLGEEKYKRGFIWLPIIGLVITIMGGIIYPFPEKYKAPWDFFASWALISFVAYSLIVLSAKPLFKLLAREEGYYGEEGDDA